MAFLRIAEHRKCAYLLTAHHACVAHRAAFFCFVFCFRNKKFLRDEVVNLKPNPHTWRAVGLTLVWTLLLDLSGLGGPTRGVNTPAGIALGVIGTHKPLSHVKATVPVSESVLMATINFWPQIWGPSWSFADQPHRKFSFSTTTHGHLPSLSYKTIATFRSEYNYGIE